MAKRKGSATGGRKKAAKRASKTSGAARTRVAKKPAARKPAVAARRKAAKSQATKSKTTKKSKAAKKPVARRVAAPKRTASKKTASKQRGAKKAAPRKTAPKKIARRVTTAARSAPTRAKVASKVARPVARKAAVRRRVDATPMRKAPALNRDRRTVSEEDMVPMPPSTLDLDRSASAVRTGRRAMRERFDQHTETSPALTGGDVDADWESAYSVGDEAPGGDNPTPDQDLVDDIGRAVGVEYQDNEELKGEEKIADRDRHRWELDPASAEDYDEH